MGYKSFGIQAALNSITTDASFSVLTGAYDQTKTNLVNRVIQRTPPGATLPAVGPTPINFLSTQDLSGTPNPVAHGFGLEPVSPSNLARIFIPLTPAAASLPIAYFTYNIITDVWAYVGKLTLTLNTATVHTVRALVVDDNAGASTGWSLHVLTTNATAANGGYFYSPNLAASDFTIGGGTNVAAATTGDNQASKKVFWMQETGGTNNLQAGVGIAIKQSAKTIYLSQATTNTIFYKFTYNTAISTVTAAGVTSDCYNFKTGANAQFGTILQTNNMKYAVPKSSQSPSLIGADCIYLSTAATGYHFLISDLSSGSTTTPSQVSWNKLGTSVDYSAVTWSQSVWSNLLDCEINYSATTGVYMMKRSINNDQNMMMFGKNDPIYAEVAGTKHPSAYAGITIPGLFIVSGVLMSNSTIAGQRGIYAINMAADKYFLSTYSGVVGPTCVISPVVSVNCAQALALAMINEYIVGGTRPLVEYRTSSFGTLNTGWVSGPQNNDLKSFGTLTNVNQIQLRFSFNILGDYGTNAQLINEAIIAFVGRYDVSDNWVLQLDNFSLNGASPVKTAAKQIVAYSGGAQTIYVNYYDTSGNLIKQRNTTSHFTEFYKSTDSGGTFAVMTGANDYTNSGAGTTVIQHRDPSPTAGVNRVSYRDVSY